MNEGKKFSIRRFNWNEDGSAISVFILRISNFLYIDLNNEYVLVKVSKVRKGRMWACMWLSIDVQSKMYLWLRMHVLEVTSR